MLDFAGAFPASAVSFSSGTLKRLRRSFAKRIAVPQPVCVQVEAATASASTRPLPGGWTEKENAKGKSYAKNYDADASPIEVSYYAGRAKSALQEALVPWPRPRTWCAQAEPSASCVL